MPTTEHEDLWSRAVETAQALGHLTYNLSRNESATLASLHAALRSHAECRAALNLVADLPTDYTMMLIDDLIWASISPRYCLEVRRLLGRMPRHEVVGVVPPAVYRQLTASPDGETYRRLAELLYHLGLDEALRHLCDAALDSDDPEIREVGEDFSGDTP